MKRILLFFTICILISGCSMNQNIVESPGQTLIDWVDFIKLNDISYQSNYSRLGRELTKEDLGEPFATVSFNVSENIFSSTYRTKNGDAAYLDEGTVIYRVKGYQPNYRLAAIRNNRVVLYEAYYNPSAQVGADYLDIQSKVNYFSINSETDGETEITRIEDIDEINRLIELLLTSPIVDDSNLRTGKRYFLALHLQDGTVTNHAYWHEARFVYMGINVPYAFTEIIEKALTTK